MFGLAQREQADKLATLTFICSHYEREGYFIISNLLNNTNLWAVQVFTTLYERTHANSFSVMNNS